MVRPDILENRERLPLAGKTAFVTGGDRDVGAGTIRALARLGISSVGSIHRDPRKAKREGSVTHYADKYGVPVHFTIGDITTPAGVQAVIDNIDKYCGGNLDLLVLNTSGVGREVNVDAAKAIVDAILPKMNLGGTIMMRQSVPGHFYRELEQQGREGEIPEFYREIAQVKNEGEESLRARIPELTARGIRLLIDCPPQVADTSNMMLFARLDPTFSQKHARFLASYGLPHIVPIEAVGHTAAQMFANPNLETGYVELYKETQDVGRILARWYTGVTTYVDQVNPKYHFATFQVPPTHINRSSEPPNIDSIEFTPRGAVATTAITKRHAQDHFRDEVGFNPLPLHKQVRTAVEIAEAIVNNGSILPKQVRLSSFKRVRCTGTIVPDTTMETKATILDLNNNKITLDVRISRDGKQVTEIGQVILVIKDAPSGEKELLEDQLIESAAQMAGMLWWVDSQVKGQIIPLLLSIGPSDFFARARAGDIITGLINNRPTDRGSDSDVLLVAGGQNLAKVTGINSDVAKTRAVRRILGL